MKSAPTSPASAGSQAREPRRTDHRRRWLGAAALLLAASTWIALHQQPWGDPHHPPPAFSPTWWLTPVERNAEQRLPVVSGEILDLWASDDGERLWAVGTGGLALRSDDGGRSWQQVRIGGAAGVEGRDEAGGEDSTDEGTGDAAATASAHGFHLPGGPALAAPQATGEGPPAEPAQGDDGSVDLQPQVILSPGQSTSVTVGYLRPGWKDRGDFEPVTEPLVADLSVVYFRDENLGWIGSDDGLLLRTVDGGRSWQQRRLGASTDGDAPRPRVVDVLFPGADFGCLLLGLAEPWLTGTPVALTRDGGATWTVVAWTESNRLSAGADATCLAHVDTQVLHLVTDTEPGNVTDTVTYAGGDLRDLLPTPDGAVWELHDDGSLAVESAAGYTEVRPPADAGDSLLIHAATADAVWLGDLSGRMWRTGDRGRTWSEMFFPQGLRPHTLPLVLPDRRVVAAGADGRLAVSRPGGPSRGDGWSWRRVTRSGDAGILSLHFFDPLHGVAAGVDPDGGGFLRRTDTGGQSWKTVAGDFLGPVVRVGFLDEGFGWALPERGGPPLYSTDGGKTWRERGGETPRYTRDLLFADPSTGLLLGPPRLILATEDGGESWARPQQILFSSPIALTSLHQVRVTPSGVQFEALCGGRAVCTSTALGEGLLVRASPAFPDAASGLRTSSLVGPDLWLGGDSGLWRVGPDGTPDSVTPRPTLSFFFLDPQHGWLAQPGGGLLRTADGGRSWQDLTPYRFYPAPWYWLAVLLSVAFLVPAIAPPPPQEVRRSVAEMAVSDRPIEAGDADPLGFEEVALGLSRFLRNTATRPPLTLAVTGEWGTGKSSLMNLLRADLARYGFRPVWFNAWHHQKEEQLLAALLENVRRQAVPSWFHPLGWVFRARLLARRLRRAWPLAVVLALAFGALVGWVTSHGEQGQTLAQQVVDALEAINPLTWVAWLRDRANPAVAAGEAPRTGALALLASTVLVAIGLYRGLRAFGVKPGALLAGLSERARLRDAQAQTGFRYRFAREFEDVTRALAPRTLTVFIDDLDRCRPQNVLDVLEAVNFLVSSGDCYVVLGIDRERVERCVGFSFRDVAEEILDRDVAGAPPRRIEEGSEAEGDDGDGRARRAAFARQYLEKLINIEVPVPRASEEGGLELLRPRPVPPPPSRRERFFAWLRSIPARWWALPSLVPLALLLGLLFGARQTAPPAAPEAPPAVSITAEARAAQEPAPQPVDQETPTAETEEVAPSKPSSPGALWPGQEVHRPNVPLWFLVALLVAGVGVWVLTSLPDVEVRDSEDFTRALEDWFPLLYAREPTPRSLKRFLNRVRFYAMRQSPSEAPRSRLAALMDGVRRLVRRADGQPVATATETEGDAVAEVASAESAAAGQGATIPEEVLVALASIEHSHPDWLGQSEFWSRPLTFMAARLGHDAAELSHRPRDPKTMVAERMPPYAETLIEARRYRTLFEKLSRGIETR